MYEEILFIESYRNEMIRYPYTTIVGFQMKTDHTFDVIYEIFIKPSIFPALHYWVRAKPNLILFRKVIF